MAVLSHFVNIVPVHVTPDGDIIDKDTATMAMLLRTTREMRVQPATGNVSSQNYPTIEEYIQLEADDDYRLIEVNQSFIVTQRS